MATPTAEKLMTAEEFAARPTPGDDSREELVEGRVKVTPPPGAEHGDLVVMIASALHAFARKHKLGRVLAETGYVIQRGPDTVRGPDASFVAAERFAGERPPATYVENAPDLAIEIVSPRDRAREVNRKVVEYLAAGAKRVWVVWPKTRTVTVHDSAGSRALDVTATLTSNEAGFAVDGFALPVREIFD